MKPIASAKTAKLWTILTTVIKHDPALNGYTPSDLPEAAKARVQNTLVSLEKELSSEELDMLETWTGGMEIFNKAEVECREGECCYYVYSDGSFYFRSSGDSEVWSPTSPQTIGSRPLQGAVFCSRCDAPNAGTERTAADK